MSSTSRDVPARAVAWLERAQVEIFGALAHSIIRSGELAEVNRSAGAAVVRALDDRASLREFAAAAMRPEKAADFS
jgi:hypothetical protein